MDQARPLKCRPEAFEMLVGQLRSIPTTQGLMRAAVAIAAHEMYPVDPDEIDMRISDIASTIRARVRSRQLEALLAHGHALLFDELGFAGNTEDYDAIENAYLPHVLETRRGLPIILSLIYKAVMERVGVQVEGVNAPMHFIVGVQDGQGGVMLVDPFHQGRVVTVHEAVERIRHATGQPVLAPAAALPVATHDVWLARILQNLALRFRTLGRIDDMNAMIEMHNLIRLSG